MRSGIEDWKERTDAPGPEIAVDPFEPREVSTSAALLKMATAAAAARRERANYMRGRATADLEGEKTRAEIARIRADTDRLTRMPVERAGDGKPPNYWEDYLQIQRDRNARIGASGDQRAAANRRLSAAKEGLKHANLSVKLDTERHAQREWERTWGQFARELSNQNPKAIQEIGYNEVTWGNMPPQNRQAVIDTFLKRMYKRVEARTRANLEKYWLPEKQKYMQIIEQESGAGDPLGVGVDENDPLNIDEGP